MKVKELMIGDWVMYNGNIFIDDEYEPSVPIEPIQIDSGEDIDLAIEGCYTPIPLTQEILKKNEIMHKRVIEGYDEWDIDIEARYTWWVISITHSVDEGWDYEINEFSIHYVHELQHALRICGLDDLSNNFKV